MVKILMKHGANPKIKPDSGQTAFDCTDDPEIKILITK